MLQEKNIRKKLWKKIGLTSSNSQTQKQKYAPITELQMDKKSFKTNSINSQIQIINISQQSIQIISSKDQLSSNKSFAHEINLSQQELNKANQIHLFHKNQQNNEQENKQKEQNRQKEKLVNEQLDQMKEFGIQIKHIQDSQQSSEQQERNNREIQTTPESDFAKYQNFFNFQLGNNKKQSQLQINGSARFQSQSQMCSPFPPFIENSINNWSSRNISKIVSKIRDCNDKMYLVNREMKMTYQLFVKFFKQTLKFMTEKQQQFQRSYLLKKSNKSINSLSQYLKQSQKMMIIQEDQSVQSFQIIGKKIEELKQNLADEEGKNNLINVQNYEDKLKLDDQFSGSFQIDSEGLLSQHLQEKAQQVKQKLPRHKKMQKIKIQHNQTYQITKLSLVIQPPQQQSNDPVINQQALKIKTLLLSLEQKQNQLHQLKTQLQNNKNQYVEYKKLFTETNNQLNLQIDQMVQKLKIQQNKYLYLEQEFVKLKDLVQLRNSIRQSKVSSKSISNNNNIREVKMYCSENFNQIQRVQKNGKIPGSAETNKLKAQNTVLIKNNQNLQLQISRLQSLIDQKNLLTSSKTQQLNRLREQLSSKNKQLEQKQNQLIILRSELILKTHEINDLRQQGQNGVTQLPQFQYINNNSPQRLPVRAYTFGTQNVSFTNNLINSPKLSQLSPDKLRNNLLNSPQQKEQLQQVKNQQTKNLIVNNEMKKQIRKDSFMQQQNQGSSQRILNKNSIQELLAYKEKKLKQYQSLIQQLTQKQQLILNQNIKLNKQIKRLSKIHQSHSHTQKQLQVTKISLTQISQIRKQLSQSNQKLYEYIFDLEQKTAKIQNEAKQMVRYYQEINQQQKNKYNELHLQYQQVNKLYQQLVGKIGQNANEIAQKNMQNKKNLQSQKDLNLPNSQNSQSNQYEARLYKRMYEDKQNQMNDLKHKYQQKTLNFLINEQIERQTDKYRLQSFKQDIRAKQQIIQNLKQQKQELLKTLKEQTAELHQKAYEIQKLNLQNKRILLDLRKSEPYLFQQNKINLNNTQSQGNYLEKYFDSNLKKQQRQYVSKEQNDLYNLQRFLLSQKALLEKQKQIVQLRKKQLQQEYQYFKLKDQSQQKYKELQLCRTCCQQRSNLKSHQKNDMPNQSSNSYNSMQLNQKRFAKNKQSLTVNINPKNSRPIFTERNYQSPYRKRSQMQSQLNLIQAEKILNSLRQKKYLPTSDRQYNEIEVKKILSKQQSPKISTSRSKYQNSFRSMSPRTDRMNQRITSPKRQQILSPKVPRKRYSNDKNSQKKLKIKIIEQKMKRLKEQVKDSLVHRIH